MFDKPESTFYLKHKLLDHELFLSLPKYVRAIYQSLVVRYKAEHRSVLKWVFTNRSRIKFLLCLAHYKGVWCEITENFEFRVRRTLPTQILALKQIS